MYVPWPWTATVASRRHAAFDVRAAGESRPPVGHVGEIGATGDPQREGAAPGHVEAVQIAESIPPLTLPRTFALLPMKTPGAVSSLRAGATRNRYRCLSRPRRALTTKEYLPVSVGVNNR